MHARSIARLAILAVAVVLVGLVPPRASAAVGNPILYVDGKHGYDNAVGITWSADWGRSTAKPFKTVERALEETKHGSPAAIRIREGNERSGARNAERALRHVSAT